MSAHPQRLLLIVNAGAGSADDAAVEATLGVLRPAADVAVAATASAEDLDDALAARDARRLVVIGGDGSLHAVVCALDRNGALDPADPVGVIALGTGNDLARTLGIPLDPAEGAAALLTGRPRRLDVLRDDVGGIVVNAVHAGVGAEAGRSAAALKDQLGAAAYPLGAVFAGATSLGWGLRIEVDGAVVVDSEQGICPDEARGLLPGGDAQVLMAGACIGRTIGGGAPLAPGAVPDDGLVDVVVCTATGPVARVAFGAALRTGEHLERDDVIALRGREVSISGDPIPLNADGELSDPVPARTWRVDPLAWSVIVPR